MNRGNQLLQRPPRLLSESEIQDFIAMVRAGGEVGDNVLEQNVRNAESLLTVRNDKCLVAVAALKNPTLSYREMIGDKSGVKLEEAMFPFELGYVFVLPSARGQGLGTKLCEFALKERDSIGVFATTRVTNAPMADILRRVGFEKRGKVYASARGRYRLQLFLRQGRYASPP